MQAIKSGCSTIFDKDYLKVNYTNPHLSNRKLKKHMDTFLEKTKP